MQKQNSEQRADDNEIECKAPIEKYTIQNQIKFEEQWKGMYQEINKISELRVIGIADEKKDNNKLRNVSSSE